MVLPDWRSPSKGARARAAIWLIEQVGAGGVFTKSQLRQAFPGVEQIDRRVRDLRSEGWVIDTARQDPSLDANELRLVAIGGEVWKAGYKSRGAGVSSEAERRAALAAGDYSCAQCGIAAGDPHPDRAWKKAQLVVRISADAEGVQSLIVLCDRCSASPRAHESLDGWMSSVAKLTVEQREVLGQWLRLSADESLGVERLWRRLRRMSSDDQELIRSRIAEGSAPAD